MKKINKIIILFLIIVICAVIIFYSKDRLKLNYEDIKLAETNEIEVNYCVNNYVTPNVDITIFFKSSIENIEYIITPDNNKVEPEGKKEVAIDYKTINLDTYVFKMKCINGNEEEYILNVNAESYPIISQEDSYAYPILTDSNVEIGKYVTIDYGTNTNNYYSLDGGNSWNEYNGSIKVINEGTIIAKSKNNNTNNIVQKIVKSNITLNLANNAIPTKIYDGNTSTGVSATSDGWNKRMNIDSSIWNKEAQFYIYTHNNHGRVTINIYDEEGNVLLNTSNNSPNAKWWWKYVTIPSNSKYLIIKLQYPNAEISEIKPVI